MNASIPSDEVLVAYYDSDYPSEHLSPYPENFDDKTEFQGIRHDVARYLEFANECRGPILELCCGTGRVAIPLARNGHAVTAVDVSAGMLEKLKQNLDKESPATRSLVQLVQQDVTQLDLSQKDFALVVIAFNSLLCILGPADQRRALSAAAHHLAEDGLLLVDVVNPLVLGSQGDSVPTPFFSRRSTTTGNRYTRFAMRGPFDENNQQRLYGWYDEEDREGIVRRKHYSMHWRPIFKPELELMMEVSGLQIESMEGGHRREPFTAQSPRMFITVRHANTTSLGHS